MSSDMLLFECTRSRFCSMKGLLILCDVPDGLLSEVTSLERHFVVNGYTPSLIPLSSMNNLLTRLLTWSLVGVFSLSINTVP